MVVIYDMGNLLFMEYMSVSTLLGLHCQYAINPETKVYDVGHNTVRRLISARYVLSVLNTEMQA